MSQPCKQLDHHNSLHLSSGADGRVVVLVWLIIELKLSAFYSLTFFRMAAIIIFKRFFKVTALKTNFSLALMKQSIILSGYIERTPLSKFLIN